MFEEISKLVFIANEDTHTYVQTHTHNFITHLMVLTKRYSAKKRVPTEAVKKNVDFPYHFQRRWLVDRIVVLIRSYMKSILNASIMRATPTSNIRVSAKKPTVFMRCSASLVEYGRARRKRTMHVTRIARKRVR